MIKSSIPYDKDLNVIVINGRKSDNRKTANIKGEKQTAYSRYIFETRIGRKLNNDEVVDHIDGDTSNDTPTNLQLLTNLENNLKKYMNKEGQYSNPGVLHMIRRVGPSRFVDLASMCTNIPIPIFDGIIELISEDLDWMKSIYMVYSNQIKHRLTCGENPKLIERVTDLISFMDDAYLSFMNEFVFIRPYYFNDFRSNTNPGIRMFNGELVNEYSREKETLYPGITPFECDDSDYQELPNSIGLTPYNY